MTDTTPRVVWHQHSVDRQQREQLAGHRGCVVGFTGLSGAGKSTVANLVEAVLHQRGTALFCSMATTFGMGCARLRSCWKPNMVANSLSRFGLGFRAIDREENIRRIGAVALFVSAAVITLTAFVSPYRLDRQRVRQWIETQGPGGRFYRSLCGYAAGDMRVARSQGLYQLARRGRSPTLRESAIPTKPPRILKSISAAGTVARPPIWHTR